MNLNSKNVLITGGTSGIGKKTAEMLKAKGANVLVTGRSANKIEAVKKNLGVQVISFDISKVENIAAKAKECLKLLNERVDVLINNAGIGTFGPIEEVSIDDIINVFNTNVFGLALLTKELVPVMKKQNEGTIINVGSSASLKGFRHGSICLLYTSDAADE